MVDQVDQVKLDFVHEKKSRRNHFVSVIFKKFCSLFNFSNVGHKGEGFHTSVGHMVEMERVGKLAIFLNLTSHGLFDVSK